ncbi:MAG: thrombospondin type 3 repeat-containing protein [Bdellovibrionota bacterium]
MQTSAVPVYHSLPSSTQKLYLNFVGCPAAAWASYSNAYSPAYDIDGDNTTFNSAELTNIQEIWKRVSEDYYPFQIDVTTESPGTFSPNQAIEVCIGGSYNLWYGSSSGGVAYLFSFSSSYLPKRVWVFEDNLGNGIPKYVAEAASHESGHGFGLQHQSSYNGSCSKTEEYNPGGGSGETGWAPIMGVSYYQNWTTWYNGHPSSSCSATQNDVELIVSNTNQISYRNDDVGGTVATASAMNVSGANISAAGVIERLSDKDVFSFMAGTGTVTLTASNFEPGPNLDLSLRLLDASQNVLATVNPGSSLDASLSTSVTTGVYFLEVSSGGSYGSIGRYSLTGTVPPLDGSGDADGDGVANSSDNCPSVANSSQTDTDHDGLGDACDSDDDEDGVPDSSDCAPLDAAKYRNTAYADPDGDGIRNSNSLETVSCFGATAPAGSTLAATPIDNCPNVGNPTQTDTDNDGVGDACDGDQDNDGVADALDCSPLDPTTYRSSAYPDPDGDGVRNSIIPVSTLCFGDTVPVGYTLAQNGPDNCSLVSNPDQADSNFNGKGDACESVQPRAGAAPLDFDGDGASDIVIRSASPADPAAAQYQIYLSSGGTRTVVFGAYVNLPAMGEYTGDGIADLAEIQRVAGGLVWRIYDFAHATISEMSFGLTGALALTGCDFTGDGVTDFALIQNGSLIYRDSSSGQTVVPGFALTPLTSAASITCADMNGDGRAELLSLMSKASRKVRAFSPKTAQLVVSSVSGAPLFIKSASNAGQALALDLNRDGRLDPSFTAISRRVPTLNTFVTARRATSVRLSGAVGAFSPVTLPGAVGGAAQGVSFRDGTGAVLVLNVGALSVVKSFSPTLPGTLLGAVQIFQS